MYSDPLSPILINGLSCTGEEDTITDCPSEGSTCTSQTRARVICQGVCVCVCVYVYLRTCACVCVECKLSLSDPPKASQRSLISLFSLYVRKWNSIRELYGW